MALLNITLNQKEILQILSEERDEAFRKIPQNSLNSILKAESKEQLRADPYERADERKKLHLDLLIQMERLTCLFQIFKQPCYRHLRVLQFSVQLCHRFLYR